MTRTDLAEPVESAHAPGSRAHGRLGPFLENVTESATACMITMLQGNLLAMTLGHWIIASRTGVLSGTLATAALMLTGGRRRWLVALMLTLATFLADYLSHPSNFGGAATEAIVTALAAGTISLLVGKGIALRRARRMTAPPS